MIEAAVADRSLINDPAGSLLSFVAEGPLWVEPPRSVARAGRSGIGAQLPILHGPPEWASLPIFRPFTGATRPAGYGAARGLLSFPLTWLEGQRQFGDAAGDVETPVTFDAERLQRD